MGAIRRNAEQIAEDIKAQSKVCCVCKERKDFSLFYNFKNKSDGKSYRCKECDEIARKKWARDNPKQQWKSARRNNLWTKYRMTINDYDKMLEDQGNCCAICGIHKSKNKVAGSYNSLSVDHNHETGKVRGLLCNQCNRGLGMLLDSEDILKKALDYLRRTNEDKGSNK